MWNKNFHFYLHITADDDIPTYILTFEWFHINFFQLSQCLSSCLITTLFSNGATDFSFSNIYRTYLMCYITEVTIPQDHKTYEMFKLNCLQVYNNKKTVKRFINLFISLFKFGDVPTHFRHTFYSTPTHFEFKFKCWTVFHLLDFNFHQQILTVTYFRISCIRSDFSDLNNLVNCICKIGLSK